VLVVALISFRCGASALLGAVSVALAVVCGPGVASAAEISTSSGVEISSAPPEPLRAAYVPIGLPTTVPAAFDPAARNGGTFDWSPLFEGDRAAEGAAAERPEAVALTPRRRAVIDDVNRIENGRRFDADHRRMDCVGYVLAKREALIRAGIPANALSPAVVRTRGGVVHAVLIVTTTEGDQVLDNLSPYVELWRHVDYEWIKRQVPTGDGLRWAWVGRGVPMTVKVASRR